VVLSQQKYNIYEDNLNYFFFIFDLILEIETKMIINLTNKYSNETKKSKQTNRKIKIQY